METIELVTAIINLTAAILVLTKALKQRARGQRPRFVLSLLALYQKGGKNARSDYCNFAFKQCRELCSDISFTQKG